ncbi:MAG: mucoidy inhibitor MuiA family protein [Bdellovibrionales bacterium]
MLRFTSTLLCLSCLLPQSAFAKDIPTDSKLVEATVYTNRANLTREAKIMLPQGDHNIVIEGLPQNIFTDSLRAKGTSNGKVTLGAVTYKMVTQAELIKPREKELNDQLLAIQDQKTVMNAEKQALEIQKKFLENIGQSVSQKENEDIARLDLDPEAWKKASSTMHTQIADNLKQSIALDQKLRELTKEETRIRTELNQLRTGQRSTYQVSIPVEAQTATTLTLSLDYQINNASWRPIYDARLSTESADLDLVLYGSVTQNTGEDWTDIKLNLSTAQPHRGAGQADLGPMWVNLNNYAKRGGGQFNEIAANKVSSVRLNALSFGSAESDMAMEEVAAAPVEIRQAQINTQGFISEYAIPGPSTVSADGSESKLLIGSFKTETKLHAEIKPQLSNQAYLVGRATLLGEAPILAGQVNLFRDDAYVGQSYLPLLRPGEKKNLAFGIDDSISVTRRALKDKTSETGIIGKDRVLERHFLTEIVNLHKTPFDIVLLQNTPVSQDEDIDVEILRAETTAGYEMDADKIKGLMRWKATLEPKAQKDIKLGWKVSWPEDKTINGL